jgi:hypothetical protein
MSPLDKTFASIDASARQARDRCRIPARYACVTDTL